MSLIHSEISLVDLSKILVSRGLYIETVLRELQECTIKTIAKDNHAMCMSRRNGGLKQQLKFDVKNKMNEKYSAIDLNLVFWLIGFQLLLPSATLSSNHHYCTHHGKRTKTYISISNIMPLLNSNSNPLSSCSSLPVDFLP